VAQSPAPGSGTANSQPASASQGSTPNKPDQDIPDAPSAVRPTPPPEENPPAQQPAQPTDAPKTLPRLPANAVPPRESAPVDQDQVANPTAKPPINIRTVPEGGATSRGPESQEELFTISVRTDQVIIPVAVKDESGRLVT